MINVSAIHPLVCNVDSLVTMESLSGNVGITFGAFLRLTELWNEIVACPVTGATYWGHSACVDAKWS